MKFSIGEKVLLKHDLSFYSSILKKDSIHIVKEVTLTGLRVENDKGYWNILFHHWLKIKPITLGEFLDSE